MLPELLIVNTADCEEQRGAICFFSFTVSRSNALRILRAYRVLQGVSGRGYAPIKLARALLRKLNHQPPYWERPGLEDTPFLIALQDFHSPAAMTRIVPIATEYVFGVRHSIERGKRRVEFIEDHVFSQLRETSGFFRLPESEHVSAILLNPMGTLTKFNRIGYLAEFGDRRVRMVRTGLARGELNPDDPRPFPCPNCAKLLKKLRWSVRRTIIMVQAVFPVGIRSNAVLRSDRASARAGAGWAWYGCCVHGG